MFDSVINTSKMDGLLRLRPIKQEHFSAITT